ncbi:lipid-A-disaccharide synthase [Roseobacter sp. HKCCA0434]|uniref:lipid-A-disaccharide synthase n=1 Tax=Roseobacter sp. HKCCA0434 TaxID=3079297 RepID=UPI002905AE32|nr:lipid-A-disaccharide synthase [Roseobacter sp. HKCCA0434]
MKLFLIAGEPSGDRLGAALMAGLKTLVPGIRFYGIGGQMMQAEGLDSLFPMEELSVMGLTEVLPRLRGLLRRRDEAVRAVLDLGVDALITIDSPDFCLRVAAKVRARRKMPVIHYVAPSVWVWREGRAAKMARHVDHVLALLPFEPPLMEAAGMTCDFVGHPVVAEPQPTLRDRERLRAELGLRDGVRVLCVLPGSREGEVARLSGRFGAALGLLGHDDLHVVVPTVPHVAEQVRAEVVDWPLACTVLDPRGRPAGEAEMRKRAAFQISDAALAASGTVGLELAMAGCPAVIAYRMSPITTFLVKRMVKTKYANLVNILLDEPAVPEVLLDACEPDNIAGALRPLLDDPQRAMVQRAKLIKAMGMLGTADDSPGLRAARSTLAAIERLS